MKYAVGFIVFAWLLCGVIGASRLDKLDADHWQDIARGPITLAYALNHDPVRYPGPE